MYKKLTGSEIRLVQIQPAPQDAIVECKLVSTSLDRSMPYQALSYVWEQHAGTSSICLDGQSFEVTKNLDAAMRHIRDNFEVQTFWIDALSINQSDILERGVQVAHMNRIYKTATKVIVWLGPTSDSSTWILNVMIQFSTTVMKNGLDKILLEEAFPGPKVFEKLKSLFSTHFGSWMPDAQWVQHIEHFFNRSWWFRVWVLQELALAETVECVIGLERIGWLHVETTILALYKMLRDEDSSLSLYNCMWYRHRTARLRRHVQQRRPILLLDLVYQFGSSSTTMATDPRDRVFAILGLATDELDLEPNYSISVESVYCRLVQAHIERHNKHPLRLSILSLNQSQHQMSLTLPSWAPDLTVPQPRCMASMPLTDTPVYFPSGNLSLPDSHGDSLNKDPNSLSIWGLCIGIIEKIGPTLSDIPKDSNFADCFKLCRSMADSVDVFCRSWLLQFDGRSDSNVDETIWRTLILDRDARVWSTRAPDNTYDVYRVLRGEDSTGQRFQGKVEKEKEIMPTKKYCLEMCYRLKNRRLFLSSSGHLGVASLSVQDGDQICVFPGAEVLYVLRKQDKGYILLGEAYLHGMMDGEAVLADTSLENFVIY